MKNNKAITMISLVVTIVILIILAGVSINMVVGDNSLVNISKKEANESEKKSLIEEIRMELLDEKVETIGRELTQDEIKLILEKYGVINYQNSTMYSLTPFDKDYEILIDELYEFIEAIKILEYDENIVMTEGDIKKLEFNYTGIAVSKEFISSNTENVTIDSTTGDLTALKAGTAKITVKLTNKNGEVTIANWNVKVVDKVTITDYAESLTMVAGNSITLDLSYTGAIKSKEFISSNDAITTVDSETGTLQAIAAGTSTVTVKLINENDVEVTKSCNVTVLAAVAQIGDVYYSSLQNAITATPDSTATTVTMLANTNESNITIAATKNINLNVNSKTITGNMTNSGTLSLSSGTIVGNGSYTINNAGTLTITSMNITNSNRVIHNTGTVTFKSGTLKCTNGGAHTVVSSKTFTMTGGTIDMTGSGSGAAFISTGTTNITSGKITSTIFGLVARGGTTTVKNSTIKATGTLSTLQVDTSGAANVTSSTISNTGGGYAINNGRGYGYCNIYSRASNYGISGSVAGKVKATTNISTGQAQEKMTLYNTGHSLLVWPTWTNSNGQDDITWDQTSPSSGTTHTYTVKKSAHGNQTGKYFVHIYNVVNDTAQKVLTTFNLSF